MKAELYHPDRPDQVVASATWDDGEVRTSEGSPEAAEILARVFRRSPVAAEAVSAMSLPAGRVVQPGDLEWFRLAALHRGREEGLEVRLVAGRTRGWDPAGTYRPLRSGAVTGTPTGTSRA
ncbi:MAG: hypothetical protein M3245_04970 [Actinomycetota bacterium]|nr:hypothetical protein [Actinomycetota bacterium]